MANATIYKICDRTSWRIAEQAGLYRGSAADLRDGFIHFSAAHQLDNTAKKHFSGQADLVLVAVDAMRLGANLEWEPSRGGDLFPHLYGPLPMGAVQWTRPLDCGPDGAPNIPELCP